MIGHFSNPVRDLVGFEAIHSLGPYRSEVVAVAAVGVVGTATTTVCTQRRDVVRNDSKFK
jgi:hypothetical protein